jgi:hypothetical protein
VLLLCGLLLQDEKEDPSMEEEGAEWNEMRAVLNTDNMVSGEAGGEGISYMMHYIVCWLDSAGCLGHMRRPGQQGRGCDAARVMPDARSTNAQLLVTRRVTDNMLRVGAEATCTAAC